jgi:hypothetical protein
MTSKTLVLLGGAALALFVGMRWWIGHDTTAEHLYGGQMVEITCSEGEPTAGEGLHMASARQACADARSDQLSRAPWLLGAGVILLVWGFVDLRSSRSG